MGNCGTVLGRGRCGQRNIPSYRLGDKFGCLASERTSGKEYRMKSHRKALLLGLCMAASALTMPTIASAGVVVDIDIAPPPIRIETVPPSRVGYVWAPG